MKRYYHLVPLICLLALVAWPAQTARAQAGDTLWVDWQDSETGLPIINALRNAIAGDTTDTGERVPNRVYGLYRSGLYYNSEIVAANNGWHLNIAGQSAAPAGGQDFGPPVIQMVVREDQSSPGRLFTVQDDITLRHVWLSGQDDIGGRGAYLPIFVEADDSRIIIDNAILERTNFALIGLGGSGNSVYVTNSVFRNHDNTSQQWEGRGIRFEAGGDTLVMENNTFLNFGHTIIQSETAPVDYVRFNHNTVVNVGRTLNSGGIWREAFFTNNLVVNPYWHGEGIADYGDNPPEDPLHTGFFTVGDLPPAYGTNLGRRIVYANNAHWRDPDFEAYYADSIRSQPMFNSETQEFFDDFSNINQSGNIWNEQTPDMPTYTTAPAVSQFPETSISLDDLVPVMIQNIRDLREGGPTPFTSWLWDPGRDPSCYEGACFYFPLPEDFSYTNAALMTAGTDGLPVGDLNWFPTAKATYESQKAEFIEEIHQMAQAERVDIVSTLEAENATLDGAAVITPAQGFTYYRFEAGGYIEWTFDVTEPGVYAMNLYTNMGTEVRRGQRVILDGTGLRNHSGYGEYYFCTDASAQDCADVDPILPTEEWAAVPITQAGLVEGGDALELEAGTHTLRIEPSWGYQSFSGVELIGPTGAITELTAPMAVSEVAAPVCDEAEFCPQGFNAVSLTGTGSLTFDVNAPASGDYLLRIFYQSDDAAQVAVSIDGGEVFPSVALEGGAAEGTSVITDRFDLSAGAHTVTLSSGAGLTVDFVQLLGVNLSTAAERNELPDGYALDQNYPNPFNPQTNIRYELGASSRVTLSVYDLLGRRVAMLVNGMMPAGVHRATFDGSNLPSGVYFYRLETNVGQQVRSMVLVK